MALKSRVFDNLLEFASTSRSRSVVTLAAVSFAIFHLVVMETATTAATGDEIPRQIIHLAAELCRFVLPLGVMILGFLPARSKSSATH
jgi:surface polysaccharide O-acyltransferase-like enzyme